MTDQEIEEKIGKIVFELETLRVDRMKYFRELSDAKRVALVAVAGCNFKLLKNPLVIESLKTIAKPNKEEKELLVELEIGEMAFKEAVIETQLKMLNAELEGLKSLTIHTASVRKAERF